jgi:hypothetical protein
MPENKNQPFTKFLLWCVTGFGIFAALVAGVIALTSKEAFLPAFGVIMALIAIIWIPTTIWGYVIEPIWQGKASDELKVKTKKVSEYGLGVLVLAGLILVPAGITGGDTWSGDGQVDLFPQGSVSKNYLVTANIKVTSGWFWRDNYDVQSVTWPDGENDTFSCTIHASDSSQCTDSITGETYTATVVQSPDRPEEAN